MPADASSVHKRAFFWMNGAAFACVAVGAVLAWLAPAATSGMGIAAILLVLVAVALAVTSYPFYRAFMRAEVAQIQARKSRPRAR